MNRAERRLRWLREDLARALEQAEKSKASDYAEAYGRVSQAVRDAVAAIDEALLEVAQKGAA